MKEYHILNLGGGIQSITLYLLFQRGQITPQIDYAIFADTQEEPEGVYRQLEWLKSLNGPPILVRTAGKLGNNIVRGRNSTGQSFVSIPVFTSGGSSVGITRRQCTQEYKLLVINRAIRREILGMKPRQRVPKDVVVHSYIGFSADEAGRAGRVRLTKSEERWRRVHFPLLENFITRADCKKFLSEACPIPIERSACVFCPYHRDSEWVHIKETDPKGWQRALEIDAALRVDGNIVNRDMKSTMYLHRSCKPLSEVEFKPKEDSKQHQLGFFAECLGMCGM